MTGLSDLSRLLAARGVVLPPGEVRPAEPTGGGSVAPEFAWSRVPRAVLQRTRAGRGGKTVTIVRGVEAEHLDEAARTLKKALGVGATVEDDGVVVQGDQVERLRTWLDKAGVSKIVGG